MSSETEILIDFLLERPELTDLISKAQFTKLFPVGTSEELINSIFKHLNKLHKEKINKINKSIIKRESIEKNAIENKLDDLKKLHDNESISKINEKLEIILQLLENEEELLELQNESDLNALIELNDELNDIVYGKSIDEDMNEESMNQLIDSINEFEKELGI